MRTLLLIFFVLSEVAAAWAGDTVSTPPNVASDGSSTNQQTADRAECAKKFKITCIKTLPGPPASPAPIDAIAKNPTSDTQAIKDLFKS